jgi:hypothetical protein
MPAGRPGNIAIMIDSPADADLIALAPTLRRVASSLYHAWATDGKPSKEVLDFCKEQFE